MNHYGFKGYPGKILRVFALAALTSTLLTSSCAPRPSVTPTYTIAQTVNRTLPAITSNVTQMEPTPKTSPTPSSNVTASPVNQIEEYARRVGISDKYVAMLGPLGKEMTGNKRTFIDALKTLEALSENYTVKLIGDIAPGGISDDEANALTYIHFLEILNPKYAILKNARDAYFVVGFGDATIKMLNDASKLPDQALANNFVDNLFFIRDGVYEPAEAEFMKNPGDVGGMFGYYLAKIKSINPSIGAELEKLPDFKNKDMKFLPAFEDVINLVKNDKFDVRYFTVTVNEMLNEGIIGKRQQCTPLENFLWLCAVYPSDYYKKFDWFPDYKKYSFSKDYKAAELAGVTWWVTSTSGRYDSERWKSFDEVAARVGISPGLVNVSTSCIFPVSKQKTNYLSSESWISPQELLRERVGNAADIAAYQATVLERNGYEAYILFVVASVDLEWADCLYKDKDKYYFITIAGQLGEGFSTIYDAARGVCDDEYMLYGFHRLYKTDGNMVLN